MLYHVSGTAGLKVLEPRVSSHGKAYVYAIENMVTGLLFGVKKDDFDFMLDEDDCGNPVLYECYPNAFEKIYRGKCCSVYEVAETDFKRGVTGWEPELVCGHAVPVQREITVDDIYARLSAEEAQGNLVIHRYEDRTEYKALISEHIVDRLIRFDMLGRIDTDERFQKYFKRLAEALRQTMDGHLL